MSLYDTFKASNTRYKQRQADNKSKSVFDSGDAFWNDYDMLNENYRSQLAPYLNYSYTPGLWDSIGNALGFNTAEDKMRVEMQDRARQALAGLLNDQFQNAYNSASAQAGRQRDAGVNPDLNGEIEGEQAAGFEQPFAPLDPSLFEPPKELTGITDIFTSAVAGLQSFAQLKSIIANIQGTKANTVNTQIGSAKEAYDLAGDILTGYDPNEMLPDDMSVEDFFHQTVVPTRKASLSKKYAGLNKTAYDLLNAMVDSRANDPRIVDAYAKNRAAATKSRNQMLVNEEVYGPYNAADKILKINTRALLDWQIKIERVQYQANANLASYNAAKYQNDFNYEQWKSEHNIPEKVGEAELADYIQAKASAEANLIEIEARKDYMNKLIAEGKKEDADPGTLYILNAVLTRLGYAPLMNNSVNGNIGGKMFGISGGANWQTMITPKTPDGLHLFPAIGD